MKKRLLNIVLTLALACFMLPVQAFATEENEVNAAGDVVYVGFTSDVHGGLTNLNNWFNNIPAKGKLQNMGYCGDYSYNTGTSYINDFKNIVTTTNNKVGNNLGVYTAGNHCYSNVDGRNNPLNPEFFNTPGFYRIGQAVNNEYYTIYCFGPATGDGEGHFEENDMQTLSEYLAKADTDEPIFILSHYPLHQSSQRTIKDADKMIELLNQYPNVVFVWGHNHSHGDPMYGEIRTKGDSITYATDQSKKINFTYLSAGGMRDGDDKIGLYHGMVATIDKDGTSVTFDYYNTSGDNTSSKTVNLVGETPKPTQTAMYRLYNPYTGEHFYTADIPEKNTVIAAGWKYEGVGWNAPTTGDPVYRVYNKYGGEHHYTLDASEKNNLVNAGWTDEGIGWYSDTNKTLPVYRQYNPYAFANNHNFTVSTSERDSLVKVGWKDENIAWYGV